MWFAAADLLETSTAVNACMLPSAGHGSIPLVCKAQLELAVLLRALDVADAACRASACTWTVSSQRPCPAHRISSRCASAACCAGHVATGLLSCCMVKLQKLCKDEFTEAPRKLQAVLDMEANAMHQSDSERSVISEQSATPSAWLPWQMHVRAVLRAPLRLQVDGGRPIYADGPITLCDRADRVPGRNFDGRLAQLSIYDAALSEGNVSMRACSHSSSPQCYPMRLPDPRSRLLLMPPRLTVTTSRSLLPKDSMEQAPAAETDKPWLVLRRLRCSMRRSPGRCPTTRRARLPRRRPGRPPCPRRAQLRPGRALQQRPSPL